MYQIRRLDLNIAYACNLACKGCLSLSDFDRKGVMPLDDIKESIDIWKQKLNVQTLSVFGGEPLLHPKLFDIFDYIKKAWPDATIRLITNGYLLHRLDYARWFDYTPFEMQVSIHRLDHEHIVTENIANLVRQKTDWQVVKTSDGGERQHHMYEWHRPGFKVWKGKFGEFVIPYNQQGNQLVPFRSDPVKAHSICGNPDVPILYKNKLYKCAPIANLLDLPNTKGFRYQGITTEDNVKKFVSGIGKPESICSMCPESKAHSVQHYDKGEVYVKHLD